MLKNPEKPTSYHIISRKCKGVYLSTPQKIVNITYKKYIKRVLLTSFYSILTALNRKSSM